MSPSAEMQRITTHLNGQLLVETGTKIFDTPLRVQTPIRDGLRVIVVLHGKMRLSAGDAPELDIRTPTSFAVFSEGENRRDQIFSSDTPFRVVLLQIERELIEREFGRDAASIVAGTSLAPDRRKLLLRALNADAAMRAVGAQLLAGDGDGKGFYRCAKALELASLVFDGFGTERAGGFSLSSSERERIRAAHDLLIANLQDPPDLASVARRCGTNLWALNRGFRAVYGMAPYAFVQEERLKLAYRMLGSRQFTVGQAAAAAGYSPAHFSTLFKRRFGVPPSALVPPAS